MELWCSYASVNIDPKRKFPYEMFVFRYPGYPGASGRVKGLPLPKGAEKHPYGLYRFRSRDGIGWEPTVGPIDLKTADSCFIYRQADGSYVSFHKTELPAFPGGVTPFDIADGGVRLIGRRTSPDGLRWSDPTRLVRRAGVFAVSNPGYFKQNFEPLFEENPDLNAMYLSWKARELER